MVTGIRGDGDMPQLDLSGFRTVAFDYGKIHFRGGALAKATPVASKAIALTENRNITFVKMSVRDQWLVAAVTGEKKYGGAFARTSLLDDLRLKIIQYCNGELDSGSDATGGDNTQDADYDPMSEVANEADPSCPLIVLRGVKRLRYKKNAALKKCVSFDMPLRCPEEDPNCTETKRIMLFIEDRKQVWLALEDVSWAVQYLYTQAHLRGVPLIDDHCPGPRSLRSIHGYGGHSGAEATAASDGGHCGE